MTLTAMAMMNGTIMKDFETQLAPCFGLLVLPFVGIGLVAGFRALWEEIRFQRNARRAKGFVVDHELEVTTEDGFPNTHYHAKVSFQDEQGRTHISIMMGVGDVGCPYYVRGERVEILYDQLDPTRARLRGFADGTCRVLGILAVMGFGTVFGYYGVRAISRIF